ncbi:hypothetical protein OU426_05070 [Frigidibacter sp. RF13]|uniref:glycosyltransferase family protein n=1 Tax=Frigidibacter sp. RF13 TaxID=2997340 RepID=UPI00226F3B35|nr:glycosyltransferase [Frigidibacter sp. RF13]MCY1126219.1 hypothetical protein [Frigidibacter sp. RF13]
MKTIRRKIRQETGVVADAGFPVMGPVHYLTYLQAAHARLRPKVYFEIGTESGASLSFAECVSIAVDPKFQLEADVSRNKPELHLFQGTSDDFFASKLVERLGLKIDLAFLDGMHLFEYLLRDFINTERLMDAAGEIFLHDCVPYNRVMAERDWDRALTQSWTGDVWKLVPILREFRPDLKVDVLDLAPTGLVVVSGLDPHNRVLTERYEEIVARFTGISLDDFGVQRFASVAATQRTGRTGPRRSGANKTGAIAIKTCVPSAEVAESWGDYHFAKSLASAFERMGRKARVDIMPDWYHSDGADALDIVLQGHDQYQRRDDVPSILWMIYPGKRFEMESLRAHDHVFVASEVFAGKLARRLPGLTPTVLHQCFDVAVRAPVPHAARSDLVFVANNHFGQDRPMAVMARQGGHPLKLWGNGWDAGPWGTWLQGSYLANDAVGDLYGRALAVLCDHTNIMARNGFLSNRVFDALACATPVIMDRVAALPPGFDRFVCQVGDQAAFDAAIETIRGEGADRRAARHEFAREMVLAHSFDARAAAMVEMAQTLSLL